MKVVFLFMSNGNAPAGSITNDSWKHQKASPDYQERFGDECYFKMFQSLLDKGTITDLKVFFESNRGPGKANFVKGALNYVVPEINLIKEYIDEDTIIFVRGGFKHWYDFLSEYKGKNWLICYAANTGRDKWTLWDVVFDDLGMTNIIDHHERYFFPFIKPTNEDVFNIKADSLKYEVCIGASYIHDKKGQWRAVELLEKFYQKYGYYLSAAMPGALRGSIHTKEMLDKNIYVNEIDSPGMLSKNQLSDLFASCKLFLHLGTGGQNDRSILEAHASGIPVCLSNTARFTPLLSSDGLSTFIFDSNENMEQWAEQLYDLLFYYEGRNKVAIRGIYQDRMGYDQVIIPMLTTFFNELNETKPNIETKKRLVIEFKNFKNGGKSCGKI